MWRAPHIQAPAPLTNAGQVRNWPAWTPRNSPTSRHANPLPPSPPQDGAILEAKEGALSFLAAGALWGAGPPGYLNAPSLPGTSTPLLASAIPEHMRADIFGLDDGDDEEVR